MKMREADSSRFEKYISDVQALAERVQVYNESNARELEKIAENFRIKTEDFYRENRKLNIGIVGQVKAGKSTFLNTLLFNGQDVLPKAATPKTATLTKIEYAEENSIYIEYYTADEWENMKAQAKIAFDEEINNAAREVMKMAEKNGIDPQIYIERGKDKIKFKTYQELMGSLDKYVGESGQYTPVVKSVTLHMDNPELKGLSIVDTPGLNDPIPSRTVRTREFMELCDVVFFLTQTTSFLDQSDWSLLSGQLPQKGVKRLVLVGSKYDSVVRDVLCKPNPEKKNPFERKPKRSAPKNKTDNIPEACRMTQRSLNLRAKEQIGAFVKDMGKLGKSELANIIRQCETPILVSSIAYNMVGKSEGELSGEEENIYSALSQFSTNMQEDLKRIGNFDAVKEVFKNVVKEKEQILERKAATFIPTSQEECHSRLSEFRDRTQKRIDILENTDQAELEEQKAHMEAQINKVRADVNSIFSELMINIEEKKVEAVQAMREASGQYARIEKKSGTREVEDYEWVSDSTWYKPWTWFKKRKRWFTRMEQYSYCLATDAVENIQEFSSDAANQVENVFREELRLREIRRKLLDVVVKDFDMSSEKYDSNMFRDIVQHAVERFEFPIAHIDIDSYVESLMAKFSGQVTSEADQDQLQTALASTISKVYNAISSQMQNMVRDFKRDVQTIGDALQTDLLHDLRAEFDTLLAQYENKKKEIATYQEYIKLLDCELSER